MPPLRQNRICSVDGCSRPHDGHGFCQTHRKQVIEFGEIRPIRARSSQGPRPCSFAGCINEATSRGLCASHAKQLRTKGVLKPLAKRRPRAAQSCSFDGCDQAYYGKGYCAAHYQQKFRYGLEVLHPVGDRKLPRPPCAYERCDRRSSRGNYCAGHKGQLDRGAPLTPLRGTLPWIIWRFESLEREGRHGCWLWDAVNARGYPTCNLRYKDEKYTLAHRLAYAIFNGDLPKGVAVHHSCGVLRCVNPLHLVAADHVSNTLESLERKAYRARIAQLEVELQKLRNDDEGN